MPSENSDLDDILSQKARYCSWKDCLEKAAWCPVLIIYTDTMPDEPGVLQLGMGICHQHRKESVPEDYILNSFWKQYAKVCEESGYGRPIRKKTKLGWMSCLPGERFFPEDGTKSLDDIDYGE
jgi:hypothetical protein